jgi:ParG
MARRQTKGKTPVIATDEEVKSVRLELPESVHREFRVEVAKEGMSMAAMAKQLVEEWLAKRRSSQK